MQKEGLFFHWNDCVSGFRFRHGAFHKMETTAGNIAEYAGICSAGRHVLVGWMYTWSDGIYVSFAMVCGVNLYPDDGTQYDCSRPLHLGKLFKQIEIQNIY